MDRIGLNIECGKVTAWKVQSSIFGPCSRGKYYGEVLDSIVHSQIILKEYKNKKSKSTVVRDYRRILHIK